MKKYIATIENLIDSTSFEIYFENGILFASTDEGTHESYDMQDPNATDREIVETVYNLYNTDCWEISDCIEYED